ncbi:MAG: methionine--tRNA ligase [Ignavibacteria bacterium RIFCSPLOWO2_12_FULL_56_21]|nr:MAG: methionine--tRNA ligase [Ignavibacteria bacterium RIFCSPLOWO2_12_FULL_56_21]
MTRTSQRILITAALPYANGYVHLGHLAGAYLPADMYARYQRLNGREVLFLCGSDEHGVAITVSAEHEKVTPKQIIDRYHPDNESAFRKFGMSFDQYSRTSIPLHHETAREFFSEFHAAQILKEREERQFYCEFDKLFLADRYVEGICPVCKYDKARGDQCENCGSWLNQLELIDAKCKLCGRTPVVRSTRHWYFPLGEYQERLQAYIQERDARDGWRETVLRYCESWFRQGLQDRAVTRDLTWGVPVPVKGFEHKVIYVWFDAVLGYISAAKEWAVNRSVPEAWRAYWQDESTKYVAFIGKDNVVFHCIVFPAMLMAWNDHHTSRFVLPENVPANEFLNLEGQKFSKSRGWGIDLRDFLRFFPADALRFALAANLPETKDADFSMKEFQARVNNELADIVGNFINRTLAFVARNFGGVAPASGVPDERDKAMLEVLRNAPANIGDLYERYKFREVVAETVNVARIANKYFNDSEPWKTIKQNPSKCATTIAVSLQTVSALSVLLRPIVPVLAQGIDRLLDQTAVEEKGTWKTAGDRPVPAGHKLPTPGILITKVEDEAIAAMSREMTASEGPAGVPSENLISIDDFRKVVLKVARVVSAERIAKSEKLLRLIVEIAGEERQIVAGIAKHYAPETLVDKRVVVVANLQPAKLMGLESRGMLLAANADDGTLRIVVVEGEIPTGSVVR